MAFETVETVTCGLIGWNTCIYASIFCPMATRSRQNVSGRLRVAIRESGLTNYRIAQDTGISESTLSRFVRGADLNSTNLDTLAQYLGLELRPAHDRK